MPGPGRVLLTRFTDRTSRSGTYPLEDEDIRTNDPNPGGSPIEPTVSDPVGDSPPCRFSRSLRSSLQEEDTPGGRNPTKTTQRRGQTQESYGGTYVTHVSSPVDRGRVPVTGECP